VKLHSDPEYLDVERPVITMGIFDGVHKGHAKIIDAMRSKADEISGTSILITFWPHPRMVLDTGTRQFKFLTTLDEKKSLLQEQGIDHLVVLPFTRELATLGACDFIEKILVRRFKIQYLLVGYNHKFGKNREGDFHTIQKCAKRFSFQAEQVDPLEVDGHKVSSTIIRQALWSGDIKNANRFLGYPFFIQGTIVGGKRIGTKIGFPTANITPFERIKILPSDGVYAVRLQLMGKAYSGMLNIGVRPTLNTGEVVKTIEVHLFDFSENIYGQEVVLIFIDRIRDEYKFSGVDELVGQLRKDEMKARDILEKSSS
jgi:riboflavin kinase/FMN adenylyltransferase